MTHTRNTRFIPIPVLIAVGVLIILFAGSAASRLHTVVRHRYHTVPVQVVLTGDLSSDNARLYWRGIGGDVTRADLELQFDRQSDGRQYVYESSLYQRGLWLPVDVLPSVAALRLTIGQHVVDLTPHELQQTTPVELSDAANLAVIALPTKGIMPESRLPLFSGVINWAGDGGLLLPVVADFTLQIYQLLLLLGLFVVLRSWGQKDAALRQLSGLCPERVRAYALGAVVLLALAVRMGMLGRFDPHFDWYYHLEAGWQLAQGTEPEYRRVHVIAVMLSWVFRIFPQADFQRILMYGALPGILLSSVTVVPVYLLGSRVSQTTGMIAAALWATSPWAIGMALYLREYAYFPFFIAWFLVAVVCLIDHVIQRNQGFRMRTAAALLYVLVFSWAALQSSAIVGTLSSGLLIGGMLLLVWAAANQAELSRGMPFKLRVVLYLVCAGIGAAFARHALNMAAIHYSFPPDWRWVAILFGRSAPQHWWDWFFGIPLPGLALMTAATVYAGKNRSRPAWIYLITLGAILVVYLLFFDRYVNTRYIFFALPLLCIVAAYGLQYLVATAGHVYRRQPAAAAGLVLIVLLLVNPLHIVRIIVSPGNNMTLLGNFLPRSRGVLSFLDTYLEPDMGIVQQHLSFPLRYEGIAEEHQIHTYLYQNPDRISDASRFIAANPSGGFIVVDEKRNRIWADGFPIGEDFTLGSTEIRYMAKMDEFYVYSWGPKHIARETLQDAMRELAAEYQE